MRDGGGVIQRVLRNFGEVNGTQYACDANHVAILQFSRHGFHLIALDSFTDLSSRNVEVVDEHVISPSRSPFLTRQQGNQIPSAWRAAICARRRRRSI
jgi:hypothetical protein